MLLFLHNGQNQQNALTTILEDLGIVGAINHMSRLHWYSLDHACYHEV